MMALLLACGGRDPVIDVGGEFVGSSCGKEGTCGFFIGMTCEASDVPVGLMTLTNREDHAVRVDYYPSSYEGVAVDGGFPVTLNPDEPVEFSFSEAVGRITFNTVAWDGWERWFQVGTGPGTHLTEDFEIVCPPSS
jgi:hypothetical protein